jgi:hypothetical protein
MSAGRRQNPRAGSHHFIVEHVDIAVHRFVLRDGRVVVVGLVNSNQELSDGVSCDGLCADCSCPAFTV